VLYEGLLLPETGQRHRGSFCRNTFEEHPALCSKLTVGWVERKAKPILTWRPMTTYRRHFVPGGSYFFTDRRLPLLTDHIEVLRAAFRYARTRYPFTVDAIVVLLDHLQANWTLPTGEWDFALRWRLIKASSSRSLPRSEPVSRSRARKGERGIWQRLYWEHTLRDEDDFARHADYIHFNPVKHGHAERVSDWPYSSFLRMVRRGLYPAD
jgi:putative transposase